MERALGADFSGVRLHLDPEAFQLSRELHAKAFTFGNDVYFSRGRYLPDTARGMGLLAHELTHTLQQRSGGAVVQRDDEDEDGGEPFDPIREVLTLAAFERRYPRVLRRFNDLSEAIQVLDDSVTTRGPRGYGLSHLYARCQRSLRLYAEAQAALDETYSIVRVMAVAARAESVVTTVGTLIRAAAAQGRRGFGYIEVISPLSMPLHQANGARAQLERALNRRSEARRVREVVREENETARREATERQARARADRPLAQVEAALRAYVRSVQLDAPWIASSDLQFAQGVANWLHGEFGNNSARYIQLFVRLERESPDFYNLILFQGTMIGYLGSQGVTGLAEHVYRDADRSAAHVFLGSWDFDEETGAERDSPMWNLLLDVLIGIVPYVGQAADARDVTGYIYRLGRYPAQRDNPWTWIGLVGSLIGFVPLAGDGAKSLLSAIRRAADEVPVGRLSDELVTRVTRFLPEGTLGRIADASDALAHNLTLRWTVIQGRALNAWERILSELGPYLTRVSDFTQRELDLVRRAAQDSLPEGLRRAGGWLGELVRRSIVDARLRAAHGVAGLAEKAAAVMEIIIEYRNRWQLAARSVEELWSPTARLLAQLSPQDRAEVGSILLQRALQEGDEVLTGVRGLLGDVPPNRAQPRADDIPAPIDATRPYLRSPDQIRQQAQHHVDELRPSTVEGYQLEIPLGEDGTWRRRQEGGWCFFNSPEFCVDDDATTQALDSVVSHHAPSINLDSLDAEDLLPPPLVPGLPRPRPGSLQADLEDEFVLELRDPDGVRAQIAALHVDLTLGDIGLGSGRSAEAITADVAALRRRSALQERFAAFARAEQAGVDREILRREAAALRTALRGDGPIPPSHLPSTPRPPPSSGLERRPDEHFVPGEVSGAPPAETGWAVSRLPGELPAPIAGQASSISYLGRTPEGEPRGVDTILNASDINTGPRPRLETPHGWEPRLGYHRTHLLAHMLGGSRYRDNLVTAASEANTYGEGVLRPSNMLEVEWRVRRALEEGQTVRYRVIPIYEGNQTMPNAIVMQARGPDPDGININVVIHNWTHHR